MPCPRFCKGMNLSNAAVAQMVEHIIRNDGAGGSSPLSGTKTFNNSTQLWKPLLLRVI